MSLLETIGLQEIVAGHLALAVDVISAIPARLVAVRESLAHLMVTVCKALGGPAGRRAGRRFWGGHHAARRAVRRFRSEQFAQGVRKRLDIGV